MSNTRRVRIIGEIEFAPLLPGCSLAGPGGQHEPSPTVHPSEVAELPPSGPAHAPGFATVNWCGVVYHFTSKQRRVIAVLWRAWKDGCPCVDTATLMQAADSDGNRLRDVFGHGQHPAWNTLVVQGSLYGGRVGTWRLVPLADERPRDGDGE